MREVYVDQEGVIGHDEREVCPSMATSYWLRAVTDDQEYFRVATVWVVDAALDGAAGADGAR